ncbi:DUF2125 domain-containing protein [uncultured Cohaesibacter sp.]|uniref:DUF2125 domain-containing protein n=1 Tax=uncultured Cohaesibacter sp. TaxID=1002546 RepID=UPI0029C8F420|nr:DUF2125 domain-containing protein [uncultured Cohaesibacter sp.]
MPADSADQKSEIKHGKGSKRFLWSLAIILLLLFTAWSGLWYYSYSTTQTLVDRIVAKEINGQKILTCHDQALGGYPVRLALDCSSYSAMDPATGWQVSGGPMQVYWQIHEPTRASIRTSSRLHIENAAIGQSLDVTGGMIKGSVLLAPPDHVQTVSLEAEEATLVSNDPFIGQSLGTVKADRLAFQLSPTAQSNSDIELSLEASELSIKQIPILNGEIKFTAIGGLDALMQDRNNPAALWLRQSGKIANIDGRLEVGQKTLKLTGDIAFNQAGLANGILRLRILNPSIETAKVKQTLSAERDGFNGPLTGLQLMGKPIRDGDLVGSEVKIKLVNGAMKAGFLPLGNLPPLR